MTQHIFIVILLLIVFVLLGQYTQETFNHKSLFSKGVERVIKGAGWIVAAGWLTASLFNL